MKNLYFFDDKGISSLVKAIVTNFISSKYYTSLIDKISQLTTKVDNITENNNSIDIVSAVYTPGLNATSYSTVNNADRSVSFYITLNKNPYPLGFDMNNSIIVASDVMAKLTNNTRYYHNSMPMQIKFREKSIECIFTIDENQAINGFWPSGITLYFRKSN